MKKMSLLLTVFVMAAMVLAACTSQPGIPATGPTTAATTSAGTTGTPPAAASPSAVAVGSPTALATSGTGASTQTTTTAVASPSAEASVTSAATGTTAAPTSAATSATQQATSAAPTSAAATSAVTAQTTATTSTGAGGSGTGQTTTPSAGTTGTQQAGVNQAQFLRLSNLMKLTVQTSDNQQVGAVNSVVIERPMVANNTSGNTTAVSASAPFVRYVVVTVNSMISSKNTATTGTGMQVLVPWQAFDFSNLSVAQNSANASQTASISTLTMSVDMATFASAPRFDVTQLQNGASNTWQSQTSQYWATKGLNASANGGNVTSQSGDMVVIGKQMNGFNIVGANNAVLGQVADFLVDTKTGAVSYAVITTQGQNGQSFFIPLSNLSWVLPVGQNTISSLGNLAINIPPAVLQNAPSFGALNNLQLSPDWVQQVNQFWQAIQSSPIQ